MELVSRARQFFFLKTSKTAGAIVELALENTCGPKGHVAVEKTPTLISELSNICRRIWPRELVVQPVLAKDMRYNNKSSIKRPDARQASTYAKLGQKFQEFILVKKLNTDKHKALIEGEFILDQAKQDRSNLIARFVMPARAADLCKSMPKARR